MMAPQTVQTGASPMSIRSFRALEAWMWPTLPPPPGTAGPSAPLRSARDDKFEEWSARDELGEWSARDDKSEELRDDKPEGSGGVKSPKERWAPVSSVAGGGALTYLGRRPSKSACCWPVRKRSCSQRKM